ncbi:MAG: cysteine dioxygenase family protein [Dehalococcoidia bacterium]
MTSARTRTSALAELVEEIRTIVRERQSPRDVAEGVADILGPHLGNPDLLLVEQQEPDPNAYRQHVLHVEDDGSFSIVSLVWLEGQETCIHDHVSWCVVGVHQGEEFETRYRLDDARMMLQKVGNGITHVGTVVALTPPGDIHKVANHDTAVTISIHVYGADIGKLGSSIRRRYDHVVVEDTGGR